MPGHVPLYTAWGAYGSASPVAPHVVAAERWSGDFLSWDSTITMSFPMGPRSEFSPRQKGGQVYPRGGRWLGALHPSRSQNNHPSCRLLHGISTPPLAGAPSASCILIRFHLQTVKPRGYDL